MKSKSVLKQKRLNSIVSILTAMVLIYSIVKLAKLRTNLNEFDENFNEKKKRFKFEIQLVEEREQLAKIDGMDDIDV